MEDDLGTEDVGTISQLNHEGDTKYTWDRKNPKECEAAREHFESLLKKGFIAFKLTRLGLKGKRTREFSGTSGGYLFKAPVEDEEPVLTREFDPQASYVVTPILTGG